MTATISSEYVTSRQRGVDVVYHKGRPYKVRGAATTHCLRAVVTGASEAVVKEMCRYDHAVVERQGERSVTVVASGSRGRFYPSITIARWESFGATVTFWERVRP